MIKVGRITSALILVVVGGLLLFDQMADTNYLGYVLDWWPLIMILLGVEYLWVNLKYQKSDRQLKLDIGGVLIAVVIVIGVVGVTQSRWIPTQWFNGVNWESLVKGELGKKFEMGTTTIPIAEKTDKVTIDNPYGSIIVQTGSVKQIEIQRTVWVNLSDESGAQEVADATHIDYTAGDTLVITSKSDINRFARKPTIQLVVTVPEQEKLNWLLKGLNGKIEAAKLPIDDELEVDTTNGSITLSDLQGKLIAHTSNGSVKATAIKGKVQLTTTNGSVTAQDITGDVEIKTSNSSVTVDRVSGKLTTRTTNGRVAVTEVTEAVQVETSNGSISVASHKVGGDWNLETSNGRIETKLPADGNYEVDGRGGSVTTNLPLNVSEKRIEGKIGTGQYKIKVNTSNSSISFQRAD